MHLEKESVMLTELLQEQKFQTGFFCWTVDYESPPKGRSTWTCEYLFFINVKAKRE